MIEGISLWRKKKTIFFATQYSSSIVKYLQSRLLPVLAMTLKQFTTNFPPCITTYLFLLYHLIQSQPHRFCGFLYHPNFIYCWSHVSSSLRFPSSLCHLSETVFFPSTESAAKHNITSKETSGTVNSPRTGSPRRGKLPTNATLPVRYPLVNSLNHK